MRRHSIITFLIFAGIASSPAYAKNDKGQQNHLPPGLQKQVENGKPLPPGWEKKLAKGQIMAVDIYSHSQIVIPVDKHGLITVRIEGKLIQLYKSTREIVDILN